MNPEKVADIIRQAIRESVLSPGAPLVQDDLARRFGISRMPVREALRILAAEGLVQISPGSGATVIRLQSEEVAELYELRLTLEPALAESIVEHARPNDVARLRALVTAMEGAGEDIGVWARANFEFHVRLYELASRPHTQRVLMGLLTLVQPYSLLNVHALGGRGAADEEHVAMVQAIEHADARTLRRLIHKHLATARDHLLASFASRPEADPLAALRGMAPGNDHALPVDESAAPPGRNTGRRRARAGP